MKRSVNNMRNLSLTMLGVLALGTIGAIAGMSSAIGQIDKIEVAQTAGAVLAKAGVTDGAKIKLDVNFWDQKEDECVGVYSLLNKEEEDTRQFEWARCGYRHRGLETGLVESTLGMNKLPVGVGGKMLTNRSLNDLSRWFSSINGQSQAVEGKIELDYYQSTGKFGFRQVEYYPLDEVEFSKEDSGNNDRHNHLFTMSFGVPFNVSASGQENVDIYADDDTFVFVGSQLVLDMGGIHDPMRGRIAIHENGEVYTGINDSDAGIVDEDMAFSGLKLTKNEGTIIRVFHADRDSGTGSAFEIGFTKMKLNVVETSIASVDDQKSSGVQVAYGGVAGYAEPLGETATFSADNSYSYMVVATVMGVMVIVFSTIAGMLIVKVMRMKY